MRVSSLLPLSHCEERERDEAILPRFKTSSQRFARDNGDNKRKSPDVSVRASSCSATFLLLLSLRFPLQLR